MDAKRNELIDRMMRLYGFENPIVIEFCRLCEKWEGTDKEKLLETIVKSHEEFPQFDSEDEEEDA